jgi:1-phosphofructokinase family hexose kinase
LIQEGFDILFFEVEGETRQNLTLLDVARQQYTKINEPGATARPGHIRILQEWMDTAVAEGDLWVFCGSLPPGAPPDLYASLIDQVQSLGGRAFLDTSGPALAAGLAARPFGIKPNSEEAAELLDRRVETDADHIEAVKLLWDRGLPLVTISRGEQGLVLGTEGRIFLASPPPVDARSPVGAGDAVVAGLLWSVVDGVDPAQMVARAVACGTAAAMQEGTGVGSRDTIEQLVSHVEVRRV